MLHRSKSKSSCVRRSNSQSHLRFKKHFVSLDAYERHKQLINNYQLYYPGATATLTRDDSKDRGVMDVIKVR